MDYSQWQQPPAQVMQPAVMNQSAVDAYYASYYGYYAPSLNPNSNSTSDLQTHESSAIAIPPPPGVVDATAAAIATASYVTVDTTPCYTLDTTAQSSAWREAVRMYGTDPLAITGAGATEQPHGIYPAGLSWPSHIVQAQLPGFVSSKKQSKKEKVLRSAYCEVCKVDCNGLSVFEQHKLGKKHLKNLEKLKTCLPSPSNTGSSSLAGPTVAVPLIGPQEDPCKSKARKKRKIGAESTEDLESKRRKVMECGAKNESVRLCRICNVVCNSDKVYNNHLAGQKHAAKAVKPPVNA